MSKPTLDACDLLGFIPQLGRIGSLNVSTAAAIAVYEARRQGWTTTGGSPQPQAHEASQQPDSGSQGIDLDAQALGGPGGAGQQVQ